MKEERGFSLFILMELPFFLGEIKNRDLKLRVCACFFFF
jgi:hypothetical protein